MFEYPGNDFEIGNIDFQNRDFIKRCVGRSGQVIETRGKNCLLTEKNSYCCPGGQNVRNGELDYPGITSFAPLRIPKKGDTIVVDSLGVREFFFLRNLIRTGNPGNRFVKFIEGTVKPFLEKRSDDNSALAQSFPRVKIDFSIFIDGTRVDTATILLSDNLGRPVALSLPACKRQLDHSLNLTYHASWIWLQIQLDLLVQQFRGRYPGKSIALSKELYLNGKRVSCYVVKNDNYFMMGDNRDNSMDSRYWGYLNRNFVKAKAFILYFSLDNETPFFELPLKIRWNRIGKLIRSWNGLHPPDYYK